MRSRENEADRRSSISNKRRSRYKPTDGRLLSRIQMRQLRLSRRRSSKTSPSQRARCDTRIYEHQPQQQYRQRKQPTLLTSFITSVRAASAIISRHISIAELLI